jgi:hypothetical protein
MLVESGTKGEKQEEPGVKEAGKPAAGEMPKPPR